jgi:putative flippase GtrA
MNGIRRFGRFNLVGLAGAGVQLLVFDFLLRALHLPGVTATPIAVEMAVLHNFLWHERFTWRDRKASGLRERAVRLWRFHAGNGLISVLGNSAVTYVLMEWVNAHPLLAAIAAIAVCAPANFLLTDRWVYAPECARRLSASR